MQVYEQLCPFYGDLHNHCNISYGLGSLSDALKNAREQLDFCSITGHAHWPDMPEACERNQFLIDFHLEGFARIKAGWQEYLKQTMAANDPGKFLTFPSFEMHSSADGDRTIVYHDIAGEILYADDLADLHQRLDKLQDKNVRSMAFPHHIGYILGRRGINWDSFDAQFAPVVEILSMHGCSEADYSPRPMLHTMGPCDYRSSVIYGLDQGHIFGFIGGTDHHCAHPGSYGHGVTGVWADKLDRDSIWDAIYQRRTYALTGDRIDLKFAVNNAPMGSVIENCKKRQIELDVTGGGIIDYVDVIKNGKLLRRISQPDIPVGNPTPVIHTKIHLELGWGPKHADGYPWDVQLGLSAGRILNVEPRFRGQEVVSPVEGEAPESVHTAYYQQLDEQNVALQAVSFGNPTNFTPMSQGICLEVEMPQDAVIRAKLNGINEEIPLSRLLAGSYVGAIYDVVTPYYIFNHAPMPEQFKWQYSFVDEDDQPGYYYVRVCQKNQQWAWSSPVFIR
jgi:Protein of unknown function (DUF3604)